MGSMRSLSPSGFLNTIAFHEGDHFVGIPGGGSAGGAGTDVGSRLSLYPKDLDGARHGWWKVFDLQFRRIIDSHYLARPVGHTSQLPEKLRLRMALFPDDHRLRR